MIGNIERAAHLQAITQRCRLIRSVGFVLRGQGTHRLALLADLAWGNGDRSLAKEAIGQVKDAFDPLANGDGPAVTWNETWGSLVLTPAEFGAGSELNDHQLQYGYWVAAASVVAEMDRGRGESFRPLIDALIADYAGTDVVPALRASGLPPIRTWSAYDGHSWASGTVPFDDGNNLESVSEAIFSSWAAARWFVVTGRAEVAQPFLAPLAIEQSVSEGKWPRRRCRCRSGGKISSPLCPNRPTR